MEPGAYGETPTWQPGSPRLSAVSLAISWLVGAIAVAVAAWIVPGVELAGAAAALLVVVVVAAINAVLPPLLAALRLPFQVAIGFFAVLAADAGALLLAAELLGSDIRVDSFGSALGAAIVMAAVSAALQLLLGVDDDDTYTLRVTRRVARHQGARAVTDEPGIVFLEIDGLGLPVLQRALRDGSAPQMARWLAEDDYVLTEWETDLSSQTGASQAGILLGSNEDIPAFRWVEKESGRLIQCSSPADCAELERRRSTGAGLLANGGCSRGNLLSGDADEAILTVSRADAEKRANPGYRAFLANGFNVTRTLALFGWELALELVAARRGERRDVRPRGHRGGIYPLMRAAMCVLVRDLVVFSVLTDMMRGRDAVYATFASYDEVAHHSGLERADTLEALRKLDRQFGRLERARRYAPRPYELVVLSDHGQTQGATFKQRNGYGLDELVERSLTSGDRVAGIAGEDEQATVVRHAVREASGRRIRLRRRREQPVPIAQREAVVLGSGNLGLVYLMDAPQRLTREQIDARHPQLLPALRAHPHVGWLLVRSDADGALVLGRNGVRHLADDRVEGIDPLAPFAPGAAGHLRRTDGFAHVADVMVGSFYDAALEEGCAFEELISFHGGLGGPQTRPFVLHPRHLEVGDAPLVGAEAIHRLLAGWRTSLHVARSHETSEATR